MDITATALGLFLALPFSYNSFNSGLDESVSFKPGTLSEDDVLLIAHELGPLWKKVGVALEVPKAVINQIEANKSEVSEKCYSKCNCVVSNGNRTERSQIRSVIIRVVHKIGRPRSGSPIC